RTPSCLPPCEGSLQAPGFSIMPRTVFPAAPPSVWHRILWIVELKTDQGMTPVVAQEVRPASFICAKRADDKNTAVITRAILDLPSEPLEFILAPGGGEIARRHHYHQDAGVPYLTANLVRNVGGRVECLVPPNDQIIKFRVDRADVRFKPANQLQCPILERRVIFPPA